MSRRGNTGGAARGRQALQYRLLVGVSVLALTAYMPAYADERSTVYRDRDAKLSPRGGSSVQLAQASGEQTFDIPAGDLQSALLAFSQAVDLQLLYPAEMTAGLRTQGVRGTFTPEAALRRLLAGTGLNYRFSDANTVTLAKTGTQDGDGPLQLGPITVEGQGQYTEAQDPVEGYRAEASKTLTRGALPLRELPNTVNVVTGDSLRDRFVRRSFDAVETVPNVVRSFDNTGLEVKNIRGFNSGGSSGEGSDGLAATNQSPIDPALIERYEVLKGPASILTGATFPGGIINRVNKRAEFDTFFEGSASGGSREFARFEGDANTILSDNPNLAGRAIFAYETQDGFVDRTDIERLAFGPSISASFFDGDAALTISGRIQREGGARTQGVPLLSNGETPDIDRDVGVFGTGNDFDRDTEEVFAEWDHRFLDNLRLNAKFGYQRSQLDRRDVYAYQFGGADLDGTSTVIASTIDNLHENTSGEVSLSYTTAFDGRDQEFLIGTNALRNVSQTDFFYDYVGSDNLFDPQANIAFSQPTTPFRNEVLNKQVGLFAQAVLRPLPGLTLVAAGRQEFFDGEFTNLVTGVTTEDDQTPFTGRLGASYEVTPWATVFGSYAESFQPQSFQFDENGDPLPPETGEQWEAGIKADLLGDSVSVTASVFQITRQNVARFTGMFAETVGEQRNRGFEFEAAGEVLPGLTLSAGYGYIDAEITEDPNAARQGNRPLHVPEHSGSLTARYDFRSGPLQGVHVGGVVNAVGSRFLDDFEQTKIDGHVRGDLFAGYQFTDNLEARVFVRNVANAQYVENPGRINGGNHFNEPLSVYATIGVKF